MGFYYVLSAIFSAFCLEIGMALYYVQRINRFGVAFYSECLSIIGWCSILGGGGLSFARFIFMSSVKNGCTEEEKRDFAVISLKQKLN
jgi:hypothetical protein